MNKYRYYLLILFTVINIQLQAQMYILNEDFNSASGTTPPSEWQNNTINGSAEDLWHFDNPGEREIGFPMIEPFAIFDADSVSNNGQPEEVSLETPTFDASISNNILMEFDHQFIKGSGSSCKIEAFNGTDWQQIVTFTDAINSITHEIVDVSSVIGGITNARIRFVWSGNSSGYWAVDNISIYGALPLDAGAVSVDNPQAPVTAGVHDIKITIGNFGYNTLNSVTVKWTANGVMQPDFMWTGSIPFGASQNDITIASYDFQQPVHLSVWTENPNGESDPNPYNDTTKAFIYPALCGTYSIGGSNPDFETFNEAVDVLEDAGISCPVTFKVRDGEYNEKIVIHKIEGTSEQNTITFESESGDSSAVLIVPIPQSFYGLELKESDNIFIHKIGFKCPHAKVALGVTSFSNKIEIKNCYFIDRDGSAINITSGSHEIKIKNNWFSNGPYTGCVIDSENGYNKQPSDITIESNFFYGEYPISINYSRNVTINSNNCNCNSSGISVRNTLKCEVKNNKIITKLYNENEAGVKGDNCDSLKIFNNFITTTGANNTNGIYFSDCNNSNIYFNSISINAKVTKNNNGIIINAGNQNIVKNNIVKIKYKGHPIYIEGNPQQLILDYNNYISPSGLIGSYNDIDYFDLDNWKAATGQDNNSLSELPFYTSDSDLSINQILLNNMGIPIPGIEDDIDGSIRDNYHPDMGAKEYDPCQNDAGINRMISPSDPVQGNLPVKVLLQNQGTDDLNAVNINWEVNGELQPSYNWSGHLGVNENTEVTIGNYNFESGLFKIKIWTSYPNGNPDCNPYNDTIKIQRMGALCGIYTIGGNNPDFENFTDAVAVLNSVGIACPVTFKVREGDYHEKIEINTIPGTSAVNTVTFESENGDSSSVIIHYSASEQYVFKIIQAEYINLIKIGFQEGYRTLGLGINDSSKYINVEHCYFNGEGGEASHITVLNSYDINLSKNTFLHQSSGIHIDMGNEINVEGNKFIGQELVSVDANQSRNVTIIKNQIISTTYCISLRNCNKSIIKNNRINATTFSYGLNTGITIQNSDTIQIFNNFIFTQGDYISYGIHLNNSKYINFYFNTLNISNTNVSHECKGLWFNGGDHNVVKNNIFNIKNDGYPVFVDGNSNIDFDYNDYHNPKGLVGSIDSVYYNSLFEWRDATGGDQHSLTVNPFFIADDQPEITQILLNNAALPIDGINSDIDGADRNPGHPDMGAKEFNPCYIDAGVNGIAYPENPVQQGNQPVKVVLQNHGEETLTSVTINWQINGEPQTPFNWTGSLLKDENSIVNVGNYNFSGGLYRIKAWSSQPNGTGDCKNYNDTTFAYKASALCGEYTIGGNNPDFYSFNEAVIALDIAGIGCAVDFKIRDGEYHEYFAINNITGSSKQNTVAFESESGDSSAVIIYPTDYSVAITLNTGNIVFKKIGLKGKYGFNFDENTDNILIANCEIHCSETGITLRGTGSQVTKCHLNNIDVVDASNVEINKNTFLTTTGISIRNERCKNIRIGENKIKTSGSFGMSFFFDDSVTITNNYIFIDQNGNNSGIQINNCQNFGVYYNSVLLHSNGQTQDNRCIGIKECGQNTVKNNIFSVTGEGYPIYYDGSGNSLFDYNNYYTPSGLIGNYQDVNYYDLYQWGTAINGDANSKTVDPHFANDSTPLPYQRILNGAGIPVNGVLLDINGKIRNDQAPDMGCWEFTVDFGITDLINPTLDCYHGGIDSVKAYLRQFGDIPFKDLKLAYQLDGGEIHYGLVEGTIYNDMIYTFDKIVDISPDGEYLFKVWLIGTLDDNINNDTLYAKRYSKPSPVTTASYDNKCTWNEVRFSGEATVVDPYHIDSYQWLFGDTATSTLQNPTYVYEVPPNHYDAVFRAYSNAGCYGDDTVNVFIDPANPGLAINPDITNETCYGDGTGSVSLNTSGGAPPYSYFMNGQPIESDVVDPIISGEYIFMVKDTEGCEKTDSIAIHPKVYLNPQIIALPDSGFAPLEVNFSFTGNQPESWQWDFGNGETSEESNPAYTFNTYGNHPVVLMLNSGAPYNCIEKDTAIIFTDVNISIDVPNVFTPNGDGINDYFEIRTNGIRDLNTKIFNRWGDVIYEIASLEDKWDGNMKNGSQAPEGVYYYYVEATAFSDIIYERKGAVMLLRDDSEVYPNPVMSCTSLKPGGKLSGDLTIYLYNSKGDLVYSDVTKKAEEIPINLSGFRQGLYFLKVCDAKGCIYKKVVKK